MSARACRVAQAILATLILGIVLAIFYASYYAAAVLGQASLGVLGALSGGAVLWLTFAAGRLG